MNVWLKEITTNDGKEYRDVLMALAKYPDVFARPVPSDFEEREFPSFLESRVRMRTGDNLPKYVKITDTYWVMLDDKPIGYATLKHEADLQKPGGHLGLCLLKEYQNKGIGSIVSELLSQKAYELGIEDLIYTSKDENIQSQKSLDKIGATLVSVHDGYHYYMVNLKDKYQERGGR